MRQTVHAAVIALVILLPGPSARAEDLARIWVYARVDAPARTWFPISCDGVVVAKIKRGRFFAVSVAPGRHVLSDEKGVPVGVDVRSGEETFVRWDSLAIEVGKPPMSFLEVLSRSAARRDMIELTYIDADKVLSRSVPKTDPRPQPSLMRRSKGDDE